MRVRATNGKALAFGYRNKDDSKTVYTISLEDSGTEVPDEVGEFVLKNFNHVEKVEVASPRKGLQASTSREE